MNIGHCIACSLVAFGTLAAAASAAEPATPARGLNTVIELLAKLDDPAAQADVLRGTSDALKGQRQVPMPPNWHALYARLQNSPNPDVRDEAVGLALMFGDADAIAALRQRAADAKAEPAARLKAIDALAQAHDAPLGPVLLTLLDDPSVRDTAVRDLAGYSDNRTPAEILQRYGKLTQPQRQDAINTLSSRAAWATALLDAVDKGAVPRTDVSALTIRQLSALKNTALSERLKKSYGTVRPHANDKAALISTYRRTFKPDMLAAADVSHGRFIFSKTCGACHTLFDSGGKLGPNLTGSQRANLDYILEKVTDPSAVVPKENYVTIIETNDGRTIIGILAHESDSTLTIRDATQDLTLPKGDIKSRRTSPTSMMPEGQLEAMTTADARDLIAYLQSPVQVPLKDAPAK